MSNSVVFDTLSHAKLLESGGVTLADVHAERARNNFPIWHLILRVPLNVLHSKKH